MYYTFRTKDIDENYLNYSMSTCYIMFTADFFIYLFLGYYLQNVIPREYGVAKPWYFLFLPSYWFGDCCKKKNKKSGLVYEKTEKKEEQVEQNKEEGENNDNGVATEKIFVEDANSDKESSNNSIFDDNPHKGIFIEIKIKKRMCLC